MDCCAHLLAVFLQPWQMCCSAHLQPGLPGGVLSPHSLAVLALEGTRLCNLQVKPCRIQQKAVLGIQQMAPLPMNHVRANDAIRVHSSACSFLR